MNNLNPTTLKQLADKLGVHPYDLHPDEDEVDFWMNEDITHTILYQEAVEWARLEGIEL